MAAPATNFAAADGRRVTLTVVSPPAGVGIRGGRVSQVLAGSAAAEHIAGARWPRASA